MDNTLYVAAGGPVRAAQLIAFNLGHEVVFQTTIRVDDHRVKSGVIFKVVAERVEIEAEKQAANLIRNGFAGQAFGSYNQAMTHLEGWGYRNQQPVAVIPEDDGGEAEYLRGLVGTGAAKLTEVTEALADLTEAVEGFLGWTSPGYDRVLCDCDPESGVCTYHNLMDVVDRVQGKRPRRSR